MKWTKDEAQAYGAELQSAGYIGAETELNGAYVFSGIKGNYSVALAGDGDYYIISISKNNPGL
jgi:hypothetical protein